MSSAIRSWMMELEEYPGWKEWRRRKFKRTFYYDDPLLAAPDAIEEEFLFSDKIEKEHAVVIQYLGLEQSILALKDCEYYFRRYPFRGLPVTRYAHITNICEMYFSRLYEFRERTKKHFNAVKLASPNHDLDIGGLVKFFDKMFDQELRERHSIQHHRRFDDLAIDHVFLTETLSISHADKGWKQEHLVAYRRLTREWAQRARRSGEKMDQFLEAIAVVTLANCTFLPLDQHGSSGN